MVVDASAVLAFLNGEPGADTVTEVLLSGAGISAVNLAEVLTKLLDYGVPLNDAEMIIADLNLTVYPFDEPLAWSAAALRPTTRAYGLSLGDRACLALGETLGSAVLTAD